MPRSQWKIPYVDLDLQAKLSTYYCQSETVYAKLSGNLDSKSKPKPAVLKTYSRNSSVMPYMVGLLVHVHNGNKFIGVRIRKDMVGKKLGEFAYTRNAVIHKKTKKK